MSNTYRLSGQSGLFFWGRAKLFGKPFGPKAQFEAARKDMEAQFQGMDLNMERNGPRKNGDGPIIDAHQTLHKHVRAILQKTLSFLHVECLRPYPFRL